MQALGLLKQWEDESAILDELMKATESRNPQALDTAINKAVDTSLKHSEELALAKRLRDELMSGAERSQSALKNLEAEIAKCKAGNGKASTLTSAIEDARKAKVAQPKIDEANACLEKLEGQGKAAEDLAELLKQMALNAPPAGERFLAKKRLEDACAKCEAISKDLAKSDREQVRLGSLAL